MFPPEGNRYLSLPLAEPIDTPRLTLRPLQPADADGMFTVLDDDRLHRFTGGRPLTLAALPQRYQALTEGRSPDGSAAWLNWIVHLHSEETATGYVQASVKGTAAEVAWVIGVPWQGQGFASEAAEALAAWLGARGISSISAAIHPEHVASIAVARHAGLSPTDDTVDGEVVWQSPADLESGRAETGDALGADGIGRRKASRKSRQRGPRSW